MREKLLQFKRLDYFILSILFILGINSLIAISSATQTEGTIGHYIPRQIFWYFVGFFVLLFVLFVNYRDIKRFAMFFYIGGIVLLGLVPFIGVEINGSQRWISLGVANLQPSEFMKIFLILFLAKYLSQRKSDHVKYFLISLGLTLLPFLIVLKQPDLGTSLVIMGCGIGIMFVSGLPLRYFLALGMTGVASISSIVYLYFYNQDLFYKFIQPHQLERIISFLNPEAYPLSGGYQVLQSLTAIGSGQLMGKGFLSGDLTKGGWIPERHTDFIFSVIGEEFGFIGGAVLIFLYFYLLYRLMKMSLRVQDLFGRYVIAGVIILLAFQIFQNIGMTIQLMPITGLALPFISYGGSALLTNMLAIGIAMAIGMQYQESRF